ncbi:hypothetical protein HMPREF9554_00926 [Treponema phagedenis F0421]|nr:hypothetical protein HMPREF9554_00926 [Treponema phagedenis F0421]
MPFCCENKLHKSSFLCNFFVYLYNKMLDRLLIVIYTIVKPKHATVYKTILLAVRRIL